MLESDKVDGDDIMQCHNSHLNTTRITILGLYIHWLKISQVLQDLKVSTVQFYVPVLETSLLRLKPRY